MRSRLLLGATLSLLLPGQALAAHLDPAPPTYNTTGQAITVGIHTDGLSTSSGVAYKLSTEPAWHRCLAHDATVTLNLPAGDYTLEVTDDTSRPWFDENQPGSATPECSETGRPRNQPNVTPTLATFYVRDAPPPVVAPDPCIGSRIHVKQLRNLAEFARDDYRYRHTRKRHAAWVKARTRYLRASRTYRRSCR